MAPDFSLGEMFNKRSFPLISYFGPPDLLADIVARWEQYGFTYNSLDDPNNISYLLSVPQTGTPQTLGCYSAKTLLI